MAKKKGRARERQRKVRSQGGETHMEAWKSQVVPGNPKPPPWGLSPEHTHTRNFLRGQSFCFLYPSAFFVSEYSLLGDTVLRTSRLILCNLQDSPERQIGAKAERS